MGSRGPSWTLRTNRVPTIIEAEISQKNVQPRLLAITTRPVTDSGLPGNAMAAKGGGHLSWRLWGGCF